jgi:penicillin V acylase-like amidase (Ntn superfamily)
MMMMEPVAVWEGIAVRRTLNAVEDVALFLLHQWPERHRGKKKHIKAQMAVLAALEGKNTVEEARAAFIAAAEQAKVLAAPEERSIAAHSEQRRR